jgi:uncharacterized repeat protein (TIGR01451 family)
MNKIRVVFLFIVVCAAAVHAQWQPLPLEDLSMTGLSPAVRADTSVKADGRIVDTDTLVAHVNIPFEGYYRLIPNLWVDSGNHQRNESFYIELKLGEEISLPLDTNAGPYKVVADDTVLYTDNDIYMERDAGLFYLKAGIHEIWMKHYILISEKYPQFINYYPDGRGINGAESLYIWDYMLIYPEPRVDAALSIQHITSQYCFAGANQNVLVPGDTMTVQLRMDNLTTDGYRNAFQSGQLNVAMPPGFSFFDFSLPPLPAFVNRTDSLKWSIDQFSDSTVHDVTISFKAVLSPFAAAPAAFPFTGDFIVTNDLDESNNAASAIVESAVASPCLTDCYIQLYSDDVDRVVNAEDPVRYILIYGNAGAYNAANPFVSITLPDYVEIATYEPGFGRTGNTFSRSFAAFQPGFADTVIFNGVVKHPVPEGVDELVAVGNITFDLDNYAANNQARDVLHVGIGHYADISISQIIATDSTRLNNGMIEHWAALDSMVQITLTVKNESPYPALNISVQDSLPVSVKTTDNQQWTIPRLEPGESQQFIITCQVIDSTSAEGAPFVNAATVVCSNEKNEDRADNKTSEIFYLYKVNLPPVTDIELTYVVLTDSMIFYDGQQLPAAIEGESLLFMLTAFNAGPDDAYNVMVRVVIPPGLENIQFDNTNYAPGDTLVWMIDFLPAGETWTLNMNAVYNNVQNNPVMLTGHADVVAEWDPDDSNNHAFSNVVILKKTVCDLTVSQIIFSDSVSIINNKKVNYVAFDEEFVIRLLVHNQGDGPALETVVVDTIPAGVKVLATSPAIDVVYGSAVWNHGTIAPGDSAVLTMTCIVENKNLSSGHIFKNYVYVTASNEPAENRHNNNSSKQFVLYEKYVQPKYDIALSYTVTADSMADFNGERLPAAVEGDTLSYQIIALNTGPNDAANVIVKNVLPAGLSQIKFNKDYYTNGDTLVLLVGSIPTGESWTAHMTAVYNSVENDPVLLTATALVHADLDVDETNNTASCRAVILDRKEFDLIVSQNIITDSVIVSNGKTVNYVTFNQEFKIRLNVLNWGDAVARNVVVQNKLPAGIKLLQAVPSVQVIDGVLSWYFDALAQGNSAFIELTCIIENEELPAGTAFNNSVNASAANEPPGNLQNNFSEKAFYLYIIPEPDLRRYDLALSHFAVTDSLIQHDGSYINAVIAGDPIPYHILLQNNGPITAHSVRVSTGEPDVFNFGQFSKESQSGGNGYFWHIDSLAAGEQWRVTYLATYGELPEYDFFLKTGALVTAAKDSTPANNSDSVVVAILDSALYLSDTWVDVTAKDNAGNVIDQIDPDQEFDFVIDYGNQADSAENVLIWFVPPPGLIYTGAGPEPSYTNGDTLFWQIDLLDGDGQIVVGMRSPTDMEPGNYSYQGCAHISSMNEKPQTQQDNTSCHVLSMTIEELPELVVDITVLPEQMDVNDSAYVSVTFSQPLQEWDINIILPNGEVISDFGDNFINTTIIQPETWYKIDIPFTHPKLLGSLEQDEILFTLTGTSIDGVRGEAAAGLIVTSSNEMHLNRNVFRAGQDDFIEIHFKNAAGSDCVIALYDLAGHLMTKIDEDYFQGGWNMVPWDGRRLEDGAYIGSGTYVVTLETQFERYFKKLIIVR